MRSAACPVSWRRRSRTICPIATGTPARDKRPAVLRRCGSGRTGSARNERRAAIEVGNAAAQAEVGEGESVVWFLEHLFAPTALGAQVDANLEAVLLDSEDAGAGVVQLVDFAFALDVAAVAQGHDLCRQIETVRISFVIAVGLHDCDVRFRVIILYVRPKIDAYALVSDQSRRMTLQRLVQQALEIASNPLVGFGGRRHHHGDTIDKLPVLFIGPAFHESAKQLD